MSERYWEQLMPLHDWSDVPAGLYHHFHQDWTAHLTRLLNRGLLPDGISALIEQRAGKREGDVLAVESKQRNRPRDDGGVLIAERPQTQIVSRSDSQAYARKANRITIKHHLGETLAIIEIVSPGNKDSRAAVDDFVRKSCELLYAGIHLLVVDPFPPGSRDPSGLHKLIWDEFHTEPFELTPTKDRVLASYEADDEYGSYVELVGVGDRLPEMPLFLYPGQHVRVPLEAAYQGTWDDCPSALRTEVLSHSSS
jgi:hypothetical protein